MNDFLDMLKSRTQFVVVDNTNTRIWEFKNYAAIAETLGYQVVVVDMHGNPRAMSLERIHILAQRCVHGLTTAQIVAQALRWEKYGR